MGHVVPSAYDYRYVANNNVRFVTVRVTIKHRSLLFGGLRTHG